MKSTATDRNVGQVAGKIPTSGKTSETWGTQNLPLSRARTSVLHTSTPRSKAPERGVRPTRLPPNQIDGGVVIVERDLQSLGVAIGEDGRDGFGEVDGLVGGLSSQADLMNPHWNLDGFGVGAIDSIENNQVLPNSSMEGLGESEGVINPE